MCSRIKIGFELVPQFRRLILEIPFEVFVAWREIPLFGPGSFFVPPDTDDHRLVILFLDDRLESILFKQTAAFDARNPAIREGLTRAPAPRGFAQRSN